MLVWLVWSGHELISQFYLVHHFRTKLTTLQRLQQLRNSEMVFLLLHRYIMHFIQHTCISNASLWAWCIYCIQNRGFNNIVSLGLNTWVYGAILLRLSYLIAGAIFEKHCRVNKHYSKLVIQSIVHIAEDVIWHEDEELRHF